MLRTPNRSPYRSLNVSPSPIKTQVSNTQPGPYFIKRASLQNDVKGSETDNLIRSTFLEKPTQDIDNLINSITNQLHNFFKKYDKQSKNYLTDEEFKNFIVEVLKQQNPIEHKYVFWNMFKVDINADKKITFDQFAPFVMMHSAEIALRRFHYNSKRGKNSLSQKQLIEVYNEAYHHLPSIPKTQPIVHKIFTKLQKNGVVTYQDFLNYKNVIARKFIKIDSK